VVFPSCRLFDRQGCGSTSLATGRSIFDPGLVTS
jgi:hypothetical protein